jgi:hypothetical protein
MKNSNRTVFAVSGMFVGILLVVLFKAIPLVLVFGVGPAVVGSIVLTAFLLNIRISAWRTLLAVLLSVPAYFVAFLAFAATMSFMQQHGLPASSLPSDMKSDVVLGLLAAVTVAGILLEALALLLSKSWSMLALAGLVGGGVGSVLLAYLANVAYSHIAGPPEGFAQILVLFGPLFIVGGGITAMIIGEQLRGAAQPRTLAGGPGLDFETRD